MVRVSRDDCRVGLCGVTAIGIACRRVAQAIFLRFPTTPAAEELDALLKQDIGEPIFGNAFVAADYRREVAPVVIQRAILAAARAGRN